MLSHVATHPIRTLLPTSFVLSYLSLSLTPSFIPLILLLTTLLLYTREPPLSKNPFSIKTIYLWFTLTISISISNAQPSIHALSTPSMSIISLILLSCASSLIALVPILSRHFVPSTGPHLHVFVFPTLWSMTWLAVSALSPIGRLATWTPLLGVDSYSWTRQFSGISGVDWITAGWASVLAELFESLIDFNDSQLPLIDIDHHESPKTRRNTENRIAPATGLLLALIVPSFFMNPFPVAPSSEGTTSLEVACILPQNSEHSQLDRFLAESRIYSSRAKILLWPEGAVTFETPAQKEDGLESVKNIASVYKLWIGVSFQERVTGVGSEKDGKYRNGMALVGRDGVEMTYYKRRLVPIAESFSQISPNEAPPLHTIDLHKPPHVPKSTWGNTTRPIPLTTSICLDFSSPLPPLSARPSLILAPARTWHIAVGRAMYELARARGDELGAEVLWCDGGASGLSGVAGAVQVGAGSWVKTIGIPYPAEERRTVYGLCGDWLVVAVLVGVPGLIFWGVRHGTGHFPISGFRSFGELRARGAQLLTSIRGAVQRPAVTRSESLLDAPVPST